MRVSLIATLVTCFSCFTGSIVAQIPAATSARTVPTQVENSESRVSQVITRAEEYFKQGQQRLKMDQREKARQDFDRAVDSILESGFDVRANERLQTFYLELIDRIYREEVPPEISIDNGGAKSIGFRDQTFAANLNDELSKLVLSQTTKSVNATSNSDLVARRREYLSSIKEYKESLQKLLGLYERSLRQAEERLARAKRLYTTGLILRSELDDAARLVSVERDRVVSITKLISDADKQVAAASLVGKQPTAGIALAGPMPTQLANGQVPAVVRYLNESLNDPYSMKLLKWSKVHIVYKYDQPFWYVSLRMRAKNGFGAYILREAGFYLKNNKVVFADNL
jgi:hypothetical protein